MSKAFTNQLLKLIAIFLGFWLAFELVTRLIAEILWFDEVGYLNTFLMRLQSQLGLWFGSTILSAWFLLGNLSLANRLKWQLKVNSSLPNHKKNSEFPSKFSFANVDKSEIKREKFIKKSGNSSRQNRPQSSVIKLTWLLPIVMGFGLLIASMVLYYSQVAWSVWQIDYSLPKVTPPVPSPFDITNISPKILSQLTVQLWKLGGIVAAIVLLFVNSKLWLKAMATILSIVFGLAISGNWTRVLQYFQATDFNQIDFQFGQDISFFIFKFPFWQLLNFWLGGLFLYGLASVSLTYLLSGNSLSQGKFPGFSYPQLRHLYSLVGLVMLTLALNHWLGRYELLYSKRGVVYGASYTDIKIQLPIETILTVVSGAIAVWLFVKVFTKLDRHRSNNIRKRQNIFNTFLSYFPFYLYLLIFIGGTFASTAVQRLVVQPNELALEKPYIERNIAATRDAFNLDLVEVKTFNPEGRLTVADLRKNYLTVDNIRLWDTRPILQTNRQLQQIRLYYKFLDADIDRYNLMVKQGENDQSPITTQKQQTIIAPRELDYSAVPERAKTWVNEHLVYTHGYGFTLSPVNKIGEGGLPYYFVQDIGTDADPGTLRTSSESIRDSIPIGKPRIYYGQLTNTYIMTRTKVPEFDFPSGEDNVYTTYQGTGGIKIGNNYGWRLLFAEYLRDWQMLFTRNFTPDTRLMFRRDINRRIRVIAPFLRYDRDPYLVVADSADHPQKGSPNYLHWIIDAYTTSDRYPYADPGDNNFNYIRNSVKVVIDAYNGDMDFYIADPSDPIVQTWNKVFPELFKSLDEMPVSLRTHIRYPQDMFSTQSERLLTYHMTDPQVFYNREDQWEIPQEIYGNESQLVKPYYLIMKFPQATSEEFILLLPYTPTSRPNLIAWLAGRSDGDNYGKLLLYQFPKQKLIYGPDQIEALINQDPIISQQISLWNREGSRAIQGNLLVIPIEQSLLYVEPLYLEAEQNSLPTLVRVIVVYENQIVMAPSLEQGLEAIFDPKKSPDSAIIRPLEEANLTPPDAE